MTDAPSGNVSLDADLTGAVQASWHRFLDVYEPLRPALYRYCRYLTRSPWDAEDLSQDALARAFVTLGCMNAPPPNPRAWLFRVASNLWIDRVRRHREIVGEVPEIATATATTAEPRATREAAGTLLAALSPQERAAVVLKDVFDLTLEEIAETLSTSVGAIKAALHRGRGKLVDPALDDTRTPVPAALDAFCDAFNARDMDRLTALLLDSASIEVVGVHTEYGPAAARTGVFEGILYGTRLLAEGKGIDPRYAQGALPTSPRSEIRVHRGEAFLLHWYAHHDGEFVRGATRVELDDGRVRAVRNYFYTPDLLADLCGELAVPFRINGYRYW